MSENEIKPVAWTSETQLSAVRKSGDGIMAATSGRWKIALYEQSAIDRLTADAASLRERMIELERQRDDYLSREWQAEKAKRKAEAERDAAVADAGRWDELCLQLDSGAFPPEIITDALHMGAGALELHIDAARAEDE